MKGKTGGQCVQWALWVRWRFVELTRCLRGDGDLGLPSHKVVGTRRSRWPSPWSVLLGALLACWVLCWWWWRSLLPWAGIAHSSSFTSLQAMTAYRGDVIAVCHPEWHGIREAAYALGEPVLEIPDVLSSFHRRWIVDAFAAWAAGRRERESRRSGPPGEEGGGAEPIAHVVIHGIPAGMPALAAALHVAVPDLAVSFVYHGAPSNFGHMLEAHLVDSLVAGAREGSIHKIGFVKNGFAPAIASFNVSTGTLWNAPPLPPRLPVTKLSERDGNVHVGILSTGLKTKNEITMMVALCPMPNVVVHVVDVPDNVWYMSRCAATFIEHGFLPHAAYADLTASLDLNLFVSLSECFPMGVIESLALSVPALSSDTSAIYAVDAELYRHLVVGPLDNPVAIGQAVTAALQLQAANPEALALRLKGLTTWLRLKAGLEWDRFVGRALPPLPRKAAAAASAGGAEEEQVGQEHLQRMQLYDLPDPRLPYTPWSALPPLIPPAADAGTAGAATAPRLTVAFGTYELAPVTWGGAGTVIAALAVQLLAAGHSVVMLAYFEQEAVAQWKEYVVEALTAALGDGTAAADAASRLTLVHAQSLLAEHSEEVAPSSDIYLQRSREFAVALKYVYADTPFDVLELFDYAGIGFELLRARRAAAARRTPSAPLTRRGAQLYKLHSETYLPASVPIALRLHGTLELLDQAEQAPRDALPLYALLERYCLETADLLYVQSRAMADVYARAYTLDRSRMVLAPPAMQRMLASLGDRGSLASQDREALDPRLTDLSWLPDTDPLKWNLQKLLRQCLPDEGCRILLVLGKLQSVKGTETVAAALPHLYRRLRQAAQDDAAAPRPSSVHVAFLGIDMYCNDHRQPMSACVEDITASDSGAAQGSHYLGPVSRAALPQLLQVLNPRAGVIASSFETFNMAAHELSYFNIPLVLSSIPAFREFFVNVSAADSDSDSSSSSSSKRPAFLFTPGDAADCARALYAAVSDDAAVADIRASPPLQYEDSLSAYHYLPQLSHEQMLTLRPLPALEDGLFARIQQADSML